MKTSKILIILFTVLLALLVGNYVVDIFSKKVPNGMVLVEQSTIDSLNAYIKLADSLEQLANLPPEIIIERDTVYLDTAVTTAYTVPSVEPDPVDSTLVTVKDSLTVNGEVSAWVEFQLRGQLEGGIEWRYKPVIKEKIITIKERVPYPVIETIHVPKAITGHYLSFNAGGNDNLFIFGVDYDVVKEKNIYGLQYQRFGDQNVYGAKIGINLNTIFKRK
jgi:hypothetical protein